MDFGAAIELWYADNKRSLPWREIKNPYLIWISEIILQQTQVVQGYGYYLRFVDRFPDVETLAAASQDEVMSAWQGLGYYSRARNLHAAARSIVEGGGFPTTYEGIRALKGVGDYTAAAIASFAFGLPHAAVDGNVYRVLSRFFGIDTPIDTTAGKRLFAELAQTLLDKDNPGIYNQALMDFGALQCTPKSPLCTACPLSAACKALAENRVAQLPVKAKRVAVVKRYFVYVFVEDGQHAYLHRRKSGDIWEGLYEPPLFEFAQAPADEDVIDAVTGAFGKSLRQIACLRRGVRHVLTHRHLVADFYRATVTAPFAFEDYAAVELDHLDRYPVPRLVEDLFAAALTARRE